MCTTQCRCLINRSVERVFDQNAAARKAGIGLAEMAASKLAINRLDFVLRVLFREFVIACLFQCHLSGLLCGDIWNLEGVVAEPDTGDFDAERALPAALSF
jgi:hypothetical protein